MGWISLPEFLDRCWLSFGGKLSADQFILSVWADNQGSRQRQPSRGPGGSSPAG